jgi:hypothetical protein
MLSDRGILIDFTGTAHRKQTVFSFLDKLGIGERASVAAIILILNRNMLLNANATEFYKCTGKRSNSTGPTRLIPENDRHVAAL